MITARAPLRLPLGGGGTDLPSYYQRFGGFFVSAAVDKYVYVSVNRPAADALIRVKYSRSEEVQQPSEVQHDLVREALQELGLGGSLEIVSMADVPAGTGMGSSGSYLAALLTALHALKRDHQPVWALAEQACRIEIELAGHPVGKQDQYVAAWGGLNCYEIDTSGQVTVTPLRIPTYAFEDLERYSLLYYTGQTRASETILSQQRQDTENGNDAVIESLHRTKEMGWEIRHALEAGNLARFGNLLNQHWQNKKARSSQISNGHIDRIYELALQNGALGGKVLGAGGGGFLYLLVDERSNRPVRDAMAAEGLRLMPFTFDLEGAKVVLNL
ncbi:MAG: galactokinase [Chloroflexi bacterium]|nr:galactokinase [Chloroflexota bacterium]